MKTTLFDNPVTEWNYMIAKASQISMIKLCKRLIYSDRLVNSVWKALYFCWPYLWLNELNGETSPIGKQVPPAKPTPASVHCSPAIWKVVKSSMGIRAKMRVVPYLSVFWHLTSDLRPLISGFSLASLASHLKPNAAESAALRPLAFPSSLIRAQRSSFVPRPLVSPPTSNLTHFFYAYQNVVVANLNGNHLCAKLFPKKVNVYTFTILWGWY